MNSRQKEILQSQLNSEEAVLKKLQGIYKKALDDIDGNIAALMGRTDTENLQSVIYQLQYQKALKTQINGILDNLNGEQFNTIADYLSKSYEDGFAGVMYDLHGQGIPLIFPINQDQVVRAIQHDTKLSKSLYDSLGEDVSLLKKRIQNNISRGIAQGSSYADVARNIASGMVGDYSKMRGGAIGKAYTIARTEGHRITNEAIYDAQKKAKEKGADSVKKWSAALDKRTRPHHAQLDGQIREIDEPFEIDGRKAMYPGGFGVAAEDINCRCRVVSVPKWALDEEELQTLKDRAEYFGLDKTDSFEEFKQKYLTIAEDASKMESQKFVPAKSIKEAEAFARDTLGIECSYKGVDLQCANDMNAAFQRGLDYCPNIKDRLNFVGSGQERNRQFKKELTDYYLADLKNRYPGQTDSWYNKYAKSFASKSVGRIDGGTYAFASRAMDNSPDVVKQFTGIVVNDKWGKNAETFISALESNVKSGWHPTGCGTIASVFDHEIAHQIDYATGLRDNQAMKALWNSLKKEDIEKGLSRYGASNIAEFIAEGYAEYCNSEKPRDIASKIGKIIEKAVGKT